MSEEEARPPPRPESSGSQRRAPARQDSDRPLPSAEQPADPDSLALLHSMGGASEAILHQLHHRGAGEANPYVQQFPGGLPQHASSHFAAPPVRKYWLEALLPAVPPGFCADLCCENPGVPNLTTLNLLGLASAPAAFLSLLTAEQELLMPYHNLGGSLPHPGLGENPPRMQV